MFHPTIIQCTRSAEEMDNDYYDELSELIWFYWENRYENPEIKMAEA